jgi:hypothetical protein
MNTSLNNYFDQRIGWSKTDSAEFPYEATVGKERWRIRLNDFPPEPLYTLLINDEAVGSFDEWPSHWQRS